MFSASPLIERLQSTGPHSPRIIDRWLRTHRVPLVEPRGVTFIYRGDADAVLLRHWIFGLPSEQPLERLEGSDFWHRFVELPPGARVEYKFEVIQDGAERWINDPLNPVLAHDPFGANSVCAASGYQRPDWTLEDPEAAPGRIDTRLVPSATFGAPRPFKLYLPAGFRRTRRYPLLIAHDGSDFLRYADLKIVLDNLIHRREIAPVIVALGDPIDRFGEYRGSVDHARFLVDELLPQLQRSLPLVDAPAARALMGASLGAVASLATAWHHPGVFGKLLLQSGSFVFDNRPPRRGDPVFEPVAAFMQAYRAAPGRPAERLYVSCGLYESLIHENRAMVPFFQGQGLEVRYDEAPDGHHWENWRDRLRRGLSWLFPA